MLHFGLRIHQQLRKIDDSLHFFSEVNDGLDSTKHSHVSFEVNYLVLLNLPDLLVFVQVDLQIVKSELHLVDLLFQAGVFGLILAVEVSDLLLDLRLDFFLKLDFKVFELTISFESSLLLLFDLVLDCNLKLFYFLLLLHLSLILSKLIFLLDLHLS